MKNIFNGFEHCTAALIKVDSFFQWTKEQDPLESDTVINRVYLELELLISESL